jgi:hypothetical protein
MKAKLCYYGGCLNIFETFFVCFLHVINCFFSESADFAQHYLKTDFFETD